MRNRTAIRLLYLLAAVAGLLPPALFLAYAYNQSVNQVERDLDFVGKGTLVRAESVVDAIAGTLRKVSTITSATIDGETLSTLRQAVFLNRFVQAIAIRDEDHILCTSEQLFEHPVPIESKRGRPDAFATPALPAPGDFRVEPPADRGFGAASLIVLFTAQPGLAIEGLVDPGVFNEFFDFYARESKTRISVYYDHDKLLSSFGDTSIPAILPSALADSTDLQRSGNFVVRVSKSSILPIRTVAITPFSSVTAKWIRSATEFAAAGIIVSALLAGMVIRVAKRSKSLEADLREAVKFGEIDVYYQPIVCLESGRCMGSEALMRWHHPQRGIIPAGDFIAVAEKSDLILPMTEVILKKVASDLVPMMQADPDLHVGINLAPQHFNSARIIEVVVENFGGRVEPNQLVFEITERGLVSDEDSVARRVMKGLVEQGAKLAVDDFGTGYSSLTYLQTFPLDYLKIDKAFVDGIDSETTSSGLVDQVIRIAKSLNMEIIAEGVEHDFQATYLRAHGVQFAQGWFFGKPMPVREFQRFVEARNFPGDNIPGGRG